MTFKCKLPWQGLMIMPNSITPCCNFTWTKSAPRTFEQYINSAELKQTRESLSQGVAPPQCKNCVTEESISGHSHRTLSNRFEDTDPTHEFEDVSIVISNTCNLKCTSCNGGGSFVRGIELKKMGLTNWLPPTYTNIPDIDLLVNYPIKTLTISGGEPFVDSTRDLLDQLVKAGRAPELDLRLSSNCTMITPAWLEYLNDNFKSTMIKASLDGVGAVNDYLRYPSDWETITANLELIKNYPRITSLLVNSVLTNLSVIKFHQLIDWCVENNYKNLVVLTAHRPAQMTSNLLPQELKQQLLPIYLAQREKYKDFSPRVTECIDTCIGICNSQQPPKLEFDAAVKWFQTHDQHRGNNLFDVFPELIPYAKT